MSYINPKSVTVDELYGAENAAGEWVQGVVPIVMADMVRDWQSDRRWKWMVFDGPVDAVWIENMNTVLDDNRKLCLASGEQIKLCPNMSVMFEVEDLSQASPATVSRCGMVYMEPIGLGTAALIDSWLQRLPAVLAPYREQLHTLCDWLLPPSLAYVVSKAHTQLVVSEMHMVDNLTALLGSLLREVVAVLEKGEGAPAEEQVRQWVESLVLFSVVWSVGSHGDVASRARFSAFFQDLIRGHCDEAEYGVAVSKEHVHRKVVNPFPTADGPTSTTSSSPSSSSASGRSVFDWSYTASAHGWTYWLADRDEFVIAAGTRFTDIVVPTVDTVRNDYLLHALLTSHRHTLMVGSTGTGKSITAQSKLLHGLDRSVFLPLFLAFSARTTAASTQDLIDSKLERRRVGVMGPPATKRCVVFVDDLNMPAKDTYGAQPPIELLRQWLDYGGWYEKKAEDVPHHRRLSAAGGHGAAGRGAQRHQRPADAAPRSCWSCAHTTPQSLKLHLPHHHPRIGWSRCPRLVAGHGPSALVDATVLAYSTLTAELLPTPAKIPLYLQPARRGEGVPGPHAGGRRTG